MCSFLQNSDLRKEFEELKKSLNKDTVAFALRDVREYAARSHDINVDTLQLKLMHLDEVSRRSQHEDKDLFSRVLERFLCHKSHPQVGLLVSTLLSSSTDARLFDKEHKFLKLHGEDKKKAEAEKSKKTSSEDNSGVDWHMMYMQLLQFGQPRFPMPFPQMRPFQMPRRPGPARPRLQNYTGCHVCGDMSHFKVDCPKLKQ